MGSIGSMTESQGSTFINRGRAKFGVLVRVHTMYLLEYGYSFNVAFNGCELKGWLAEPDWNVSSISPDIGNVYADLIRHAQCEGRTFISCEYVTHTVPANGNTRTQLAPLPAQRPLAPSCLIIDLALATIPNCGRW